MAKRKTRIRQAEIVRQFAVRLRELRQAKGLTQADLARQAHVALSHLSKLESGDAAPGLDLLDRLARALGTTVTGLLPPAEPDNADARRESVKRLFEGLVSEAGPDTLAVLEGLLARLVESASSKR
jgi:transcriptional regulator with XRE-family HTH domain